MQFIFPVKYNFHKTGNLSEKIIKLVRTRHKLFNFGFSAFIFEWDFDLKTQVNDLKLLAKVFERNTGGSLSGKEFFGEFSVYLEICFIHQWMFVQTRSLCSNNCWMPCPNETLHLQHYIVDHKNILQYLRRTSFPTSPQHTITFITNSFFKLPVIKCLLTICKNAFQFSHILSLSPLSSSSIDT